MDPEDLDQRRFPNRCSLRHCLLLRLLPHVVATGRHLHQLAEQPHGVVVALRCDETVPAHWSGVCENLRVKLPLAMAFLKISSSCACRRLATRNWRNLAAVVGSSSATGVSAFFCH